MKIGWKRNEISLKQETWARALFGRGVQFVFHDEFGTFTLVSVRCYVCGSKIADSVGISYKRKSGQV